MVGDGCVTSFWLDYYTGNVSLMEQLLRHLQNYVKRRGKVVEMDTWIGECLSLRFFVEEAPFWLGYGFVRKLPYDLA